MEIIHSRIVWEGKWRLRVETLRLDDGRQFERGAIEHPGAVVIAPLLPDVDGAPQLLMLRQYRHTLDQTILELPAGTREAGEPWPLAALVEMAQDGRLEDGKSVVAVLRAAREIKENGYG